MPGPRIVLHALLSSLILSGCTESEESLRRSLTKDVNACRSAVVAGQTSASYLRRVYRDRLDAWQRGAALTVPEAFYLLGRCYQLGFGLEKDASRARELYEKASLAGIEPATHSLAVTLRDGRGGPMDYPGAEKLLRVAIEKQYAPAMVTLGGMYKKGQIGGVSDLAEAERWFQRADELGSAQAQNLLGVLRVQEEDYVEAVKWYRKAATNGCPSAMTNLAELSQTGQVGGRPDHEAAKEWLLKAAALDDARAMMNLGWLYATGGFGRKPDFQASRDWYLKVACLEGSSKAPTAMCRIAELHWGGWLSGKPNLKKGEEWLLKAAAHDDVEAMDVLAALSADSAFGDGKPNHEKSAQWSEKAMGVRVQRALARIEKLPENDRRGATNRYATVALVGSDFDKALAHQILIELGEPAAQILEGKAKGANRAMIRNMSRVAVAEAIRETTYGVPHMGEPVQDQLRRQAFLDSESFRVYSKRLNEIYQDNFQLTMLIAEAKALASLVREEVKKRQKAPK